MREYELTVLVHPDLEMNLEPATDKIKALIEGNGGKITKEDRWGKRRLAYDIKKESEGFYVLFYVTCEPECVAECDRVMKITDEILKHMIVRSDEKEAQE